MKRLRRLLALAGGWLILAACLVAAILDTEPTHRKESNPWTPPRS